MGFMASHGLGRSSEGMSRSFGLSCPNMSTLGPIMVEGLCMDPVSHVVTIHQQPVQMGPTEYRLLEFFLTHQDRVYTRSQLLDHVWGGNVYVEERTVDVHIRRLRKALQLESHDRFIQTVRGTGYRFSTKLAMKA